MSDDLDPAALAMLRRIGGQDLVSKMITIFLERAPAQMKAARAALGASDLGALAESVHALKSSAGQLGARAVFDLAGRIEALARTQAREDAAAPLEALESAFARALPLLEAEKGAP